MSQEPTTPEADAKLGEEPLGDGGKKALQAEREARKLADKTAADLQSQLDALNAASLSDLEKAQKAAADAEADAATARREALRYRIAGQHGISTKPGEQGEASDADLFLTADTEEAMQSQAERLAARTPAVAGTPKPDLTQGGHGKPAPGTTTDLFVDFMSKQLT